MINRLSSSAPQCHELSGCIRACSRWTSEQPQNLQVSLDLGHKEVTAKTVYCKSLVVKWFITCWSELKTFARLMPIWEYAKGLIILSHWLTKASMKKTNLDKTIIFYQFPIFFKRTMGNWLELWIKNYDLVKCIAYFFLSSMSS